MNKITIAIDGYSSTGKSTVAKQLAKYLGYTYVDTGAMYRAVTYYAMENNLISDNEFNIEGLVHHLPKINISFKFNKDLGFAEVYLNNINIENEIRTLQVSRFVSKIAAVSEVRKLLVAQQKKMGKKKGVVMDGRDIGTVVFEDAELKLFMTASSKKRALRRYEELLERGEDVTYDAVLKNVEERDFIDTTRKDSPLVKAKDAITINNSEMSLKEQYEKILHLANSVISRQ